MEFLKWPLVDLDIKAKSEMFYNEQSHDMHVLEAFQQRRCAICGHKDNLQIDHCHESGFIRGLLCQPCNIGEGKSDHPTYIAYRRVYPTKVLGLKMLYRHYSRNALPAYFHESELDVSRWDDEKCYNVLTKMTTSYLVNLNWVDDDDFIGITEKSLRYSEKLGRLSQRQGH